MTLTPGIPDLGRTRPPPDPRHNRSTQRWWPILTPLMALVVGVSLLFPAIRHQWALSLIRQSARYTVLSFNDASALPAAATVNQPIAFSFNVGNHEGRAVDYRYIISESSGKTSHILRESSRSVAAGTTWTVSQVVRLSCRSTPCHIQVSLPGHPETVDFLVALKIRRAQRG